MRKYVNSVDDVRPLLEGHFSAGQVNFGSEDLHVFLRNALVLLKMKDNIFWIKYNFVYLKLETLNEV